MKWTITTNVHPRIPAKTALKALEENFHLVAGPLLETTDKWDARQAEMAV